MRKNIKQKDFWSNNPCDIDGDFKEVSNFRYKKEPYLLNDFRKIVSKLKAKSKILEIGSGQGIDALNICSLLSNKYKYIGVDYSKISIETAKKHAEYFIENSNLGCIPYFEVGDALNLNFKEDEFDFIYSMGVLHHTPNINKAIDEIYRVLKKDGRASIYLYRSGSIKVEIAKFLRKIQKFLDLIFKKDLTIFQLLKDRKSKQFGTMFLECFGVPFLTSISSNQVEKLFYKFSSIKYKACGNNFHFANKFNNGRNNRFGVYLKINLVK